LNNSGPHGFSEILYAYMSGAGNNGSAFAGLNANTLWYNVTLGLDMFFGRFFMLIPILGIAGSLAAKKKVPASAGTFPVTGPIFTIFARRRDRDCQAPTFLPFPGPVVTPSEKRGAVLMSGGDLSPTSARSLRPAIVVAAIRDSFAKLEPRLQARNPVMFVVLVGAVLVTLLLARDVAAARDVLFDVQIALWLWFTLLFANFAEAMA
jgi:hypothetical protein